MNSQMFAYSLSNTDPNCPGSQSDQNCIQWDEIQQPLGNITPDVSYTISAYVKVLSISGPISQPSSGCFLIATAGPTDIAGENLIQLAGIYSTTSIFTQYTKTENLGTTYGSLTYFTLRFECSVGVQATILLDQVSLVPA